MSIYTWPADIALRNAQWSQVDTDQVQRSPFSGKTKIVQLGTAARWTVSGELPPLTLPRFVTWRGFRSALLGRVHSFRLIAVEAVQHGAIYAVCVDGGGQTGALLNLKAGPNSTTLIKAGSLITVEYPSGDEQLIALRADLVFDGVGKAAASLATPLRESPANESLVETRQPWALMRMVNPKAWSVEPGRIYGVSLEAEEAF